MIGEGERLICIGCNRPFWDEGEDWRAHCYECFPPGYIPPTEHYEQKARQLIDHDVYDGGESKDWSDHDPGQKVARDA